MDKTFRDVLYNVMTRSEATELIESGHESRAAEQETYRQREDNYRRSRRIDYDYDYRIYRYGQGGLRI
jgi:hypothetical protein